MIAMLILVFTAIGILGLFAFLSSLAQTSSGKAACVLTAIITVVCIISALLLIGLDSSGHLDLTTLPDPDPVYYLASLTSPRDNPDVAILGVQTVDTMTNKTSHQVNFFEASPKSVGQNIREGDFIKISPTKIITKWNNPFLNQSAR